MRPRHVIAAAGLALVALLGVVGGTAAAQTTPPPAPLTCAQATAAETKARADLAAALPPLLEFSPNVYPGGTVPTLAQLPGLLEDILADPDLGAGARGLVDGAVKLQTSLAAATAARVNACAPTTTTTPNPPTTTPNPTTTTPNPSTTTPLPTTTPRPPTTTPAPTGDDAQLPADNNPADQFRYVPNVDNGIATGGK